MTMPQVATSYAISSSPVIACGVEFTEEQLDEAICGSVKELLIDVRGASELSDLLSGVATTDFEQERLSQLLDVRHDPEDWLIGEALAEAYVSDKDKCIFPWPTSRDLKNPEASPAGADLTGFQIVNDELEPYRFAFGEVKTSNDENYPPNVMYGRTGLKNQLEGLVNSFPTKQSLVLYLGHHAANADWQHMYKSATKRFLGSGYTDIAIFGVLVRDVTPNESDLSHRAKSLAKICPSAMTISLYALYLPVNSIAKLQAKSRVAINGGGQ